MPNSWKLRPQTHVIDILLATMADFAAACKAQGDMSNYFRWRNLMHEVRLRRQAELSRESDAGTVSP